MEELKLPPVIVGWSDRERGWVSQNDHNRMNRIRMTFAVGRAKDKLTVLEWNAVALYVKETLRDEGEY